MSYCEAINSIKDPIIRELNKKYHDLHYGFPINNDNDMFGRFILEINQAGLSWNTILKKENAFRHAYSNFDIQKIAHYNDTDINRLLSDKGIIRNKLKINAAIYNAQVIMQLQKAYGTWLNWLVIHKHNNLEDWIKLFKKHFKFTGKEIVLEFLMSTSFITGAHQEDCPTYKKILASNPYWLG